MDANGTISEANHAVDKSTAEKHTAGKSAHRSVQTIF